jgi:hypothetical protein
VGCHILFVSASLLVSGYQCLDDSFSTNIQDLKDEDFEQ